LLLVLFELAQEQYAVFSSDVVLSSTTSNELGQELWLKLHKGLYNALGKTLSFTSSWCELSCRCGLVVGGTNHKLRQKQLERLCEVVVWETQKELSGKEIKRQSYLVSWLLGDDEKIHLALNCRLASALLGEHYAQVSMAERLSLLREPARAVHAFLSTTVSRGKSLKIGVDTLMQRLWPDGDLVVPAGTLRRRRKDVRDALDAIGALAGWSATWERAGMAYVRRNKTGSHGEIARTIANKDMSYREQVNLEKLNKINGLRAFDVSGLFSNKVNNA
jgi:hypothetical protein